MAAATDGEVTLAQAPGRGFGNVVVPEPAGGYSTGYAPLVTVIGREKASVPRGEPIGRVGTAGNATGHHLPFEVRHGGVPLEPLRYLPETLDDPFRDLAAGRR